MDEAGVNTLSFIYATSNMNESAIGDDLPRDSVKENLDQTASHSNKDTILSPPPSTMGIPSLGIRLHSLAGI